MPLVKTTNDLLKKPISLVANRDPNGFASGSLFLDGGISIKEITGKQFEYYKIKVQANSIQMFFD